MPWGKSIPEEVFRHVSLFIPNRTELSSFSGVEVSDVESAVRAAGVLFGKGVGKMIVTMGSRGSLIVEKDGHEFIPALKVDAVDTTGAGDTYCGALCVALAEGKSLPEAARFATASSAISVTKMGAQTAIPSRAEIDAFLKSNS